MHNPDDKYPTRPGFEPRTSEFQATTGPNEPSEPACFCCTCNVIRIDFIQDHNTDDVRSLHSLIYDTSKLSHIALRNVYRSFQLNETRKTGMTIFFTNDRFRED